MNTSEPRRPTPDDVAIAQERIAPYIRRTPLLKAEDAGPAAMAPNLWIKPENLQRTGSFKLRGAMNAVAALPEHVRARGLVTHSSGNHGQAVAAAAHTFGVPATIVIPEGAPAVKVERTLGWGATVVRCAPSSDAREAEADRIVNETGATLIPPYDHFDVVAGQGTIGLEIAQDLPSARVVYACLGGGGLASGITLGLHAGGADARVIAAEPELAADGAQSLEEGRIVRWSGEATGRTIADGVRTQSLGRIPFEILNSHRTEVETVTDDSLIAAQRTWFDKLGMRVEPTGCLTLAAFEKRKPKRDANEPTVLVISGGNGSLQF